ncbi:unnamed protein product [Brachionus calyciflorus]|uniref:Molybdopterin synthase catalytic subunit n=1 Tax=Brachionus calyciflorus TaxID=104777 RepID=A0A813QBE5_9BILA|nr:unnamed protein product [Brachionus calyciflorus]
MTDYLEITTRKLDLEEITQLVNLPECGAISVFIGTTRNNMNGKLVKRLEYEAYNNMAIKEMKKICDQIRLKWSDIRNIAIFHRIGEVQVQQSSIIIAISSPHRKDSLEAVDYCINEFKRTVPIWKKEWYDDSTYVWKENCECIHHEKKISTN